MIIKKINVYIFIILTLSSSTEVFASGGLSQYEISVLSMGEGHSLADAFGHSGIRVKNTSNSSDVVFNFGIYDYDAPNFYSNFVRGRPEYKLGVQNYKNFAQNYIDQGRYIVEHKIRLDENSSNEIINLLLKKLENPSYIYDYLKDNCSTRIADLLIDKSEKKLESKSIDGLTDDSFRKMIHSKLNENSWGALGIDICLGAVIDRQVTLRESLFLPGNLMKYLDEFNNEKLISRKILYQPETKLRYSEKIPSPILVNFILSLVIIYITFLNFKNNSWTKIIDYLIFMITGTIGLLIIYLWFFSNHIAGAQNFNFLWAFPLNLILIFSISKKKIASWNIGYFKFLIIVLCLLFLHWLTGVQKYNITLLPIFVALFIRYSFIVHKINILNNENLYQDRR